MVFIIVYQSSTVVVYTGCDVGSIFCCAYRHQVVRKYISDIVVRVTSTLRCVQSRCDGILMAKVVFLQAAMIFYQF